MQFPEANKQTKYIKGKTKQKNVVLNFSMVLEFMPSLFECVVIDV